MTHTVIPEDELKTFASLKDVKVVVDVGSRDDVDYLILKPGIELHCFEPDRASFKELTENVGNTPNVYLNNYALGEIEGYAEFGGETMGITRDNPTETTVPVRRLDNYIREHNITQIDFLKMDVEGYEDRVMRGLGEYVNICRYIQYEQGKSGNKNQFDILVSPEMFDLYYTGYRNVLAVRKGEELPWIPEEPKEGGAPEKDATHYLKHDL